MNSKIDATDLGKFKSIQTMILQVEKHLWKTEQQMPHVYFCQIRFIKTVEEVTRCTLEPPEELPEDNHGKGPYPERF